MSKAATGVDSSQILGCPNTRKPPNIYFSVWFFNILWHASINNRNQISRQLFIYYRLPVTPVAFKKDLGSKICTCCPSIKISRFLYFILFLFTFYCVCVLFQNVSSQLCFRFCFVLFIRYRKNKAEKKVLPFNAWVVRTCTGLSYRTMTSRRLDTKTTQVNQK